MTPLNFGNLQNPTPEDEKILNRINKIMKAAGQEPIEVNFVKERLLFVNHAEDSILIVKETGHATGLEKKYVPLKDKLESSVHNARYIILTIGTVGTMKAGKSTLQAAIYGSNIAPSRNSAATSIPTLFVYDPSLKQPRLEVPDNFIKTTRQRLKQVKQLIKKEGLSSVQSRLDSHPQAKDLLKKIQEESLDDLLRLPLQDDSEQICAYLEKINDYYRIFSMLSLEIPKTEDYPKVYTPFYGIDEKLNGTCVFIDTPGRNDISASNEQFQKVLDQSQKVILVVNYNTDIGADAFENNVKPLCREIIQLRGVDSLIVVVNQIDGRKSPNDTTPEQIVELFQTQLGVKEEQIIEVSSLEALESSTVRRELEISSLPLDQLKQIESVQKLAKIEEGKKWKQWLETATPDDILKAADENWANSGFGKLVEVIKTMLKNSENETLKAMLTLAKNSLELSLKDLEETTHKLDEQERNSIHLLEQVQLTLTESEDKLKSFKDSLNPQFRSKYESHTTDLIHGSFRHQSYDYHNTEHKLNRLKERCSNTASMIWQELTQSLQSNFKELQSKLIDSANKADLALDPFVLELVNQGIPISHLTPASYEEKYTIEEKEEKVKIEERKRIEQEPVYGLQGKKSIWYARKWGVIGVRDKEVTEYINVPYIETRIVEHTRTVYYIDNSHYHQISNEIYARVNELIASPLIESISLESYHHQLEAHKAKLTEDFNSKQRTLTLLKLQAQAQLPLLEADLDVVMTTP